MKEEVKISKKFAVDKRLLPIKAYYLIYNAALASVLPFRPLYGKSLGVTSTETGVIFAIMPFVMVLTNPLCGAIVDHFKAFRILLYTLLLIVGISHVSLTFIPEQESLNTTANENFSTSFIDDILKRSEDCGLKVITPLASSKSIGSCITSSELIAALSVGNKSSFYCILLDDEDHQKCVIVSLENINVSINAIPLFDCSKILGRLIKLDHVSILPVSSINGTSYICLPYCGLNSQNSSNIMQGVPLTREWHPFYTLQFWLFLFLIILSNTSHSAVEFLMDAVCYEVLEDKPEKYGQQRLWGTIGFGMGSLLGGYLNQLFSGDSGSANYSPCFYLLGVLVLLVLLLLQYVRVVNVKYSKNIMKDVLEVLSNSSFLIYAITVFCVGTLSGFVWHYEMWFLEDLGASPTLLGLTQAVQCFLSELPCFLFAGWVCKKIGYPHCNSIALLCFFLRYLVYVQMENPWLALPVGLLHGPAFGLFFTAMTAYAREQALSGTEATVQACLQVVFEGLGAATGSILGGICVDKVGSRTTFMYAAILSFSMFVLNVLISLITKPKRLKSNKAVIYSKDQIVTEAVVIPFTVE